MSYTGPKVHIDLAQLAKNYQLVRNEVDNIPVMATVKANDMAMALLKCLKY